jgi:hypothetical protein
LHERFHFRFIIGNDRTVVHFGTSGGQGRHGDDGRRLGGNVPVFLTMAVSLCLF